MECFKHHDSNDRYHNIVCGLSLFLCECMASDMMKQAKPTYYIMRIKCLFETGIISGYFQTFLKKSMMFKKIDMCTCISSYTSLAEENK